MEYSKRMSAYDFQGEFIDMILAAAVDPNMISFAGGLPNPTSFPVEALRDSINKTIDENGYLCFQYNSTEGYMPLRQKIADRYKQVMDLDFKPEEIIITTGSQQAIDLFSSTLLNPGDKVVVENPTYLAALQVFHHYDPEIVPVELTEEGIDTEALAKVMDEIDPKFMYVIPNFQNPTGLTYTEETRQKVAEIIKDKDMFVFEDNPYTELRFKGTAGHSLAYFLPEKVCLIGTFSKIVAPGMRLGWLAIKDPELRAKIATNKSSVDLHSSIFDQMVLNQFLEDNDLDEQINKTKAIYREKVDKMIAAMKKYVPSEVKFTEPEGGMFMWATLPEGIKAVDVQYAAVKKGLLVLAGDPFYEYDRDVRTMRINFSNATDEEMERGMQIFGETVKSFME